MLSFLQSFLGPRPSPIGIDFGTDALRMSQVQFDGSDFHLIATATAPVPSNIRHDLPARMDFFSQTARDLLAQGKFSGRQVVLGLPSAWTFVHTFQTTASDERSIRLGAPPEWHQLGEMHLRHIVAGQRMQENQSEWAVILLAARKAQVDMLLTAAHKARLDVRGLTAEMSAMVDCFAHVYRRKADANSTTCYLDIGSQGSRVVIARGGRTVFMRNFAIGGDELNAAVAARLKLQPEDARLLRQKVSHAQTGIPDRPVQVGENEPAETAEDDSLYIDSDARIAGRLEKAIRGPLYNIVQELQRVLDDHDNTFPAAPVDRLVLCGGEARNRFVVKYISAAMGIPTQVGDPMVRLSKSAQQAGGIDRRQAQPMWAVSLGLSMGPAQVVAEVPTTILPPVQLIGSQREAA